MLDKIIKIAVTCGIAFLVASPQILDKTPLFDELSFRTMFRSGTGVLILAGLSILAYWKISDLVKGRSAQNNS